MRTVCTRTRIDVPSSIWTKVAHAEHPRVSRCQAAISAHCANRAIAVHWKRYRSETPMQPATISKMPPKHGRLSGVSSQWQYKLWHCRWLKNALCWLGSQHCTDFPRATIDNLLWDCDDAPSYDSASPDNKPLNKSERSVTEWETNKRRVCNSCSAHIRCVFTKVKSCSNFIFCHVRDGYCKSSDPQHTYAIEAIKMFFFDKNLTSRIKTSLNLWQKQKRKKRDHYASKCISFFTKLSLELSLCVQNLHLQINFIVIENCD